MNKTTILVGFTLLLGCATQKSTTTSNRAEGDTRTRKVTLLDDNTYLLKVYSKDSTYAFTPENAVKVGGIKESTGPKNERRFLNGLAGPNGETLQYSRRGSCCSFKSPNGLFGSGLLDLYSVYWRGSKDTLSIYINMYDKGDLEVPVGLSAKKK